MEAYFDNSATTKVLDCVKDAVVDAMCVNYGNAAAKHRKGVEAENLIREAKKAIADTLKVQEKEILFTSGGTESNNTALSARRWQTAEPENTLSRPVWNIRRSTIRCHFWRRWALR